MPAFRWSTFATLLKPTSDLVVPERILAALKLSTLPNPTFALVTPARIVAVESVLAPKPLAVTVPPPAPESTPALLIEILALLKLFVLSGEFPAFSLVFSVDESLLSTLV